MRSLFETDAADIRGRKEEGKKGGGENCEEGRGKGGGEGKQREV